MRGAALLFRGPAHEQVSRTDLGCSDRAQFSHNIGLLHHQLINETDDVVPVGLWCCMDQHISGENSILLEIL